MQSYIICATPRTGSTLLCGLLAATGRAGRPDSFFMSGMDPAWAAELGLPDPSGRGTRTHAQAYLDAAIAAGRGDTGIFGLRLMRENLGDLMEMIDLVHPGQRSDPARLSAAFGDVLCIHLTREDKLAQAVSLVKAEQTGLWHVAPDGTEIERLGDPRAPAYDFARIDAQLSELEGYDRAWQDWFAAQGIAPLRIGYETLSEQPATELARICAALGIDAPDPGHVAPGVARLADRTSAEWIARYRSEAGL